MRAVTFQAPGEIRVDERPEPRLEHPDEAIIQVEASGICGSDLHIFHGRVPVEAGTTIGHEYVGTVLTVSPAAATSAANQAPGSDTPGVPASLTTATVSPAFIPACSTAWYPVPITSPAKSAVSADIPAGILRRVMSAKGTSA